MYTPAGPTAFNQNRAGLRNTAASGIICTNMPSAEDNVETPEE